MRFTPFAPEVVGRELLESEHELMELPARFDCLALADRVKTSLKAFEISQEATRLLKDAEINTADHTTHCQPVATAAAKERDDQLSRQSSQLIDDLRAPQLRTLQRIVKNDGSGWITVLPLHEEG